MTLLPLMQFIFDSSWPNPNPSVFLTATKVWGPLSVGLIAFFAFAPFWVALIGFLISMVLWWANPKFYESINWEEVIDNG